MTDLETKTTDEIEIIAMADEVDDELCFGEDGNYTTKGREIHFQQWVSVESLIKRLNEWIEYYDSTFLTNDKPILKILKKELEQVNKL